MLPSTDSTCFSWMPELSFAAMTCENPFTFNYEDDCSVAVHWRVAPGITVLVVCIIGICLVPTLKAYNWKWQYLHGPFGLGTLSSLFLIWIGYNYGNLKSFEESNETYKQNNVMLGSQVQTLSHKNQELTLNVDGLTKQVAQAEILQKELIQLNSLIGVNVTGLQEIGRASSLNNLKQEGTTENLISGVTTFKLHIDDFKESTHKFGNQSNSLVTNLTTVLETTHEALNNMLHLTALKKEIEEEVKQLSESSKINQNLLQQMMTMQNSVAESQKITLLNQQKTLEATQAYEEMTNAYAEIQVKMKVDYEKLQLIQADIVKATEKLQKCQEDSNIMFQKFNTSMDKKLDQSEKLDEKINKSTHDLGVAIEKIKK